MSKDKLDMLAAAVCKRVGDGGLRRFGTASQAVEVIPTGSMRLDLALGCGGWPLGRIVELFGHECVDADTFINYTVRAPDGSIQNSKGGTIERLYQRFHQILVGGKGLYQRPQTLDSEFFAPSINEEGRVIQNRVLDVVQAGEKECFTVQLKGGASLIASADHEFFVGDGYRRLSTLSEGDVVYIHNKTPYRGRVAASSERPMLYIKHHPFAPIKVVTDQVTGKPYEYHRLRRSRGAMEAYINGMELHAYVSKLNAGELAGLQFLQPNEHVHHKDEDWQNDAPNNLVVISPEEHGRMHALERHNNLRFIVVPDEVVSIIPAGCRQTYDMCMEAPYNNYVANGVVVHNSGGKSTLSLHACAQAQALGHAVVYVDAEHALDPTYATRLGVKVDDLLLSQPMSGEEALDVVDEVCRAGAAGLVIVDSVAALTPKAELEGEMGDMHVGQQARMMGKGLRKITANAAKSRVCALFINQLRQKIGGPPSAYNKITPGGDALKYFASVRVDVSRGEPIKDRDQTIGNTHRARVVKNKLAPPFQRAEFDMLHGHGIDRVADLASAAIEAGAFEVKGSWYSLGGERVCQGRIALTGMVREDPVFRAKVAAALAEVKPGMRWVEVE